MDNSARFPAYGDDLHVGSRWHPVNLCSPTAAAPGDSISSRPLFCYDSVVVGGVFDSIEQS